MFGSKSKLGHGRQRVDPISHGPHVDPIFVGFFELSLEDSWKFPSICLSVCWKYGVRPQMGSVLSRTCVELMPVFFVGSNFNF